MNTMGFTLHLILSINTVFFLKYSVGRTLKILTQKVIKFSHGLEIWE